MPLLTACTTCAAKVKVRDELIGKAIKCPKCGKVFKSRADGESNAPRQAAPKPAAKKPVAAWDGDATDDETPKSPPSKKKPPSRKQGDDDDDDDDDEDKSDDGPSFQDLLEQTTLSPDVKKQVASELNPRERGVWVGQPDAKIMTLRGIPKAFSGGVFLGILAVIVGIVGKTQFNIPLTPLLIAALVVAWAVFSLCIAVLVLFMERKKALGTAYVITSKRCITFNAGWFGPPYPTSYQRDLLMHLRRMPSWIFGDDAGDLVFRSITTITTTRSRRGTSTSVRTTYYGFLGVRRMNDVAEIINRAILSDDDEDDDDDDDDDDRRRKKKRKRKAVSD